MTDFLSPKGELGIRAGAPRASGDNELNVALYPYVPLCKTFEGVVQNSWQKYYPDFQLNFFLYDPYTGPPPSTMDVFAFDCAYTGDLVAGARLDLIDGSEVQQVGDLLPFAREAATDQNSGKFAGIPYLACCTVLFYRKNDPQAKELARADLSTAQLHRILGDAPQPDEVIPPPGHNLIIELSGSVTASCMYVQAWEQQHGRCEADPPLPQSVQKLDAGAVDVLKKLVAMAGKRQAGYKDPGHDRVDWFAQKGLGRVLVGFTEFLYAMEPSARQALALRLLPLDDGASTPCYADAIGIRPGLGERRAMAVKLANLVASQEVLFSAARPSRDKTQYLVPARTQTLAALAKYDALYENIWTSLSMADPCGFRLGKSSRSWISEMGPQIVELLLGIPPSGPSLSALSVLAPEGFAGTPAGIWRRGF
ncbi:thiamine pyridinylase [Streptomyces massasporeus]